VNNYISGNVIRILRGRQKYTQKQLADRLGVSDKTISKWETGKGLPDITLIEPLAEILHVSVMELMKGEWVTNKNLAGKMSKTLFYVCPVCGNVICAVGEGVYSCCGIVLPLMEAEESDEMHEIAVDSFEAETIISLNHEMTKDHYISFIACTTTERVHMKKLYPEQSAEAEFLVRGHGYIYVCCNRHGLYRYRI